MRLFLCLLVSVLSLFSTNIFADYIDIQSPSVIQAGEFRKFSVLYYGNDGTVKDVSDKVTFNKMPWPRRATGEYFITPAFRGVQTLAMIEASYTGENGVMLTDNLNVSVDSTPLALDMMGPITVYRRGTANYFATAVYRDARIDVTSSGDWTAIYGLMSFGGFYRPPVNPNIFSDTLTFRYGNLTRYFIINFY